MIKRLNNNLSLKSKGFTLAEAVFSLFVTILVLSILQNLLFCVKKVNLRQNMHVNELAYAYVQLNNFMHDKNTKKIYLIESNFKNKAGFTKVRKNGERENYFIDFYLHKKALRVYKDKGGYMPLLFNVEQAKFETNNDQIIIHVTETDKRESDLVFKLDKKSEDQDEKSKSKRIIKQRLSFDDDPATNRSLSRNLLF